MAKHLQQNVIEFLNSGTPAERKYICEIDPVYFGIYYFSEFFDPKEGAFPLAPFHYDFCEDHVRLMRGELDATAWIAFAESAKTSWSKILAIHAIAYKKRSYINWDSYDKTNAEQALFDITIWLQTNERLIQDFGHLYNEGRDQDRKTKKQISDFITTNGVRVEAHSTQESVRGRVFGTKRPDHFIFDDIENQTTIQSAAITQKVINHFEEVLRGLSSLNASIVVLGNYLSETGSVAYIMEKLNSDPRAVVRNIPVETPEGEITWPGKYVKTDAEAAVTGKVSLENKRRKLANYEAEMLNRPSTLTDVFFDRVKVEAARAKAKPAVKKLGMVDLWADYTPGHRYALGADTAEGIGRDAQSLALIDFAYSNNKAALVGSFANNTIGPDTLGYETYNLGMHFGGCLVAPERNNTGHVTILVLTQQNYPNIYLNRNVLIAGNDVTKKYGFVMGNNKYNVFYDFKKAFENDEIDIWDIEVLNEMFNYSMRDLEERTTSAVPMMTRHFDKLTAVIIAWSMRKFAASSSDPFEEADEMLAREENYKKSLPF